MIRFSIATLAAALSPALSATAMTHPAAHSTTTEVQIAIDAQGTIDEITPKLRGRLGLFDDLSHFRRARIFDGEDGNYVLETEFLRDGALARRRSALAPAGLDAFRLDLDGRLERSGLSLFGTQEGRGRLVFNHSVLALGFYGWALPAAANIDDPTGATVTYLLTSAAGIYLPFALTDTRTVSVAHRVLNEYGATRGIGYGVLLHDLLLEHEGSFESGVGFAMGASVAGAWLGYRGGGWLDQDAGRATLIGVLGDYGLAYGLGAAYVGGLYDDERSSRRPADALALAGGIGGLAAGRWLGERRDHSHGDALLMRSAGVLGAQLALPLAEALGNVEDAPKLVVGMAMGGAAGGLLWADGALEGRHLTEGESLLISAAQLAGSLVALGITRLIDSDTDNVLLHLSGQAAGATLGFGWAFRQFGKD